MRRENRRVQAMSWGKQSCLFCETNHGRFSDPTTVIPFSQTCSLSFIRQVAVEWIVLLSCSATCTGLMM